MPDGHRRVAQELAAVDDPLRSLGPHPLAQFGDLLPAADREGLRLGDFWPRLAALPAKGLAVDLSCSAGRALLGLGRTAGFALGIESSFVAARIARDVAAAGRAALRIVEEGAFAREAVAEVPLPPPGRVEVVVADPERPPLAPGIAGFVLAANLLERQGDPAGFVRRSASLLAPGGILAIASPFAWWEETVPREAWLGRGEERARDALLRLLREIGHEVVEEADLELVLRESARVEQIVRPHLVVSKSRG
jgi:SAM-dependent methyltransferase